MRVLLVREIVKSVCSVGQIHEATAGVSGAIPCADHLSMFEVYMMRHPDVLRKVLHPSLAIC